MKYQINTLPSEVVENAVKTLRKGTYQHLGYISYPTTLKRAKQENAEIRKQTLAIVRFGIEYKNMAVNEGKETGSMLYGKYEKGDYTYIVTREDGKKQLVAYISKVKESVYYFNGEVVTIDWLIENKYISAPKPYNNPTHRIQPMTTNIFKIGKLSID